MAAQAFETESFRARPRGNVLGDTEELGLALELLNVRNDPELEQFLGDVFKSIGSGLQAVGSFAAKNVLPVVGPALKQLAKTALPIAGGALGSLIPIPGVGTALGSALGNAAANALEMEVSGLDQDDAAIERARRLVRVASSVMHEVALAPASAAPDTVVRTALVNAISRHLPAAAAELQAMMPSSGHEPPSPSRVPAAAQGTWRRHGARIVVEGL
jgi:hypothetical protein